MSQTLLPPLVLGIVCLGFGICFGFRASDFGFDLNAPVMLSTRAPQDMPFDIAAPLWQFRVIIG